MAHLLRQLLALEPILACHPLGLITDVDGTISPIAPSPKAAIVSPRCRDALERLVPRLALVAALSGRTAQDARALVGVEGLIYGGNHGLEWWQEGRVVRHPGAGAYLIKARRALNELKGLLSGVEGLQMEDKGVAIGIHYRQCSKPQRARETILQALSQAPSAGDFTMIEGRKVVELRPPLPADKGTALEHLLAQYQLRGALYLGDDLTDLDAFAALHRWMGRENKKGATVAVVSPDSPPRLLDEADFTLNGTTEVEDFLIWLGDVLAPGPATAP